MMQETNPEEGLHEVGLEFVKRTVFDHDDVVLGLVAAYERREP